MALFTMLYYYLSHPDIHRRKKKTPNVVSQIRHNFLLKDIFEQLFRNFFSNQLRVHFTGLLMLTASCSSHFDVIPIFDIEDFE